MHLHWHRRDLRISDNRGLTADEPTVPLFVFDPVVLEHAAPPRIQFMLDGLSSLREAYHDRGTELLLARGPPREVVPAVAEAVGVDVVSWCQDYTGLARERDGAVERALEDAGIQSWSVHDAVHHKPGSITTNEGNPYKVFTYYSRKWHDRKKRNPVAAPETDELVTADAIELPDSIENRLGDLPTSSELGFDDPEADVPPAGTDAARELLDEFCTADIYQYAERRDYPADDCTSRLSPHLKFGTIGIREVWAATDEAHADATDESARDSVTEFQDQLAWREFYTQVLWDRPDVVSENYRQYEQTIEWRDDPERLQAWKDGRTGYPLVDAGMRQLRSEAYMHNRVRMVVASFLTKDLLLDWREGYDWFCQKLVDHDTANDNGGWQWAASTGTDAQPYFRVFNPMTQGERFDPDAEYIREYVPELAGVPAETVHAWDELDAGTRRMHAPDYPDPIVDHGERREAAIAMFEYARGG